MFVILAILAMALFVMVSCKKNKKRLVSCLKLLQILMSVLKVHPVMAMHSVLTLKEVMSAPVIQAIWEMDLNALVIDLSSWCAVLNKSCIYNYCLSNLYFMVCSIDIDECSMNITTCINSDCINQNGTFSCSDCYAGFRRIGNDTKVPCSK